MQKILITGATGNVGREVIDQLNLQSGDYEIIPAFRNGAKAEKKFDERQIKHRLLNFEEPSTYEKAFTGVDMVFLLRPPHITDIENIFEPMILKMKKAGVKDIIFLSVQGAEKIKFIPHFKIERIIKESGLNYVFLRPGYFMQNLTTTLIEDILAKKKIILPAGNSKFNWIDIRNIAEITKVIIFNFNKYKNKAYEITGCEKLNFYQAAETLTEVTGINIRYQNVNPLRFYFIKKREGEKIGKIFVMIALHFLPRFQNELEITDFYEEITGKKPTKLSEFVKRESRYLKNRKY